MVIVTKPVKVIAKSDQGEQKRKNEVEWIWQCSKLTVSRKRDSLLAATPNRKLESCTGKLGTLQVVHESLRAVLLITAGARADSFVVAGEAPFVVPRPTNRQCAICCLPGLLLPASWQRRNNCHSEQLGDSAIERSKRRNVRHGARSARSFRPLFMIWRYENTVKRSTPPAALLRHDIHDVCHERNLFSFSCDSPSSPTQPTSQCFGNGASKHSSTKGAKEVGKKQRTTAHHDGNRQIFSPCFPYAASVRCDSGKTRNRVQHCWLVQTHRRTFKILLVQPRNGRDASVRQRTSRRRFCAVWQALLPTAPEPTRQRWRKGEEAPTNENSSPRTLEADNAKDTQLRLRFEVEAWWQRRLWFVLRFVATARRFRPASAPPSERYRSYSFHGLRFALRSRPASSLRCHRGLMIFVGTRDVQQHTWESTCRPVSTWRWSAARVLVLRQTRRCSPVCLSAWPVCPALRRCFATSLAGNSRYGCGSVSTIAPSRAQDPAVHSRQRHCSSNEIGIVVLGADTYSLLLTGFGRIQGSVPFFGPCSPLAQQAR